MTAMAEAEGWALIAAERRAFADLLEPLADDQWATPSLCAGWTVREVVAHIMVGPAGRMRDFAVAMLRARLRFHRANHLLAVRGAARPTSELIGQLRTHADSRFSPPGMDWRAPLTDLYLHREDCCVPLGVRSGADERGWPVVLDLLCDPKAGRAFGAGGGPQVTWRAVDAEWSQGSGPVVEGPARALALAMSRRPALLFDLTGPGAPVVQSWVSPQS